MDGGQSPCRMSIIRNGNVALSIFKKASCRPVDFKKVPCRMSQRPKKGCVAVSILGVYTHTFACSGLGQVGNCHSNRGYSI